MSTRSLTFSCNDEESAAIIEVYAAVNIAIIELSSRQDSIDLTCRKAEIERIIRSLNKLSYKLKEDIVYTVDPIVTPAS